MLRAVLLGVGVTTPSAGLVAALKGCPTIPLSVFGAVLSLAPLLERYVYKPVRTEPPGAGSMRVAEQFAYPGSGQIMAVYFNRMTGERRYVATGNE